MDIPAGTRCKTNANNKAKPQHLKKAIKMQAGTVSVNRRRLSRQGIYAYSDARARCRSQWLLLWVKTGSFV